MLNQKDPIALRELEGSMLNQKDPIAFPPCPFDKVT